MKLTISSNVIFSRAMSRWLKGHFCSFACHLVILVLAIRWLHSTSELLVAGLGSMLFLDRYLLRLLPWGRVHRGRELAIWTSLAAAFAGVFYCLRPGIVPIEEASQLGIAMTLLFFELEVAVGLATGRHGQIFCWQGTVWLRLALLGLAILISPLVALHPLHTVPKRTPAALGLEFEEIGFETEDCIELAGWLVPHPDARGNAIFCHGHGRSRGHVVGFLPTLHDLGLNVLAFDFRGHGMSAGHTSTFGHREVRDLQAAVAYLNNRYPDKPLVLMGVSLGAAVSLQALPSLPNVCAVWSESSFSRLDETVNNYFGWMPAPLRGPMVTISNGLAWLDCGFWGPSVNPIDCLKEVTVPICFCHGWDDELIPFAQAEALYDAYTGPKAHYWVEGGTHYNLRQHDRDEYLQRLRAFLNEHLGIESTSHPAAARRSSSN